MEMGQVMSQTAWDQLVCSEQSPNAENIDTIFPPQSQQFLHLYAKLAGTPEYSCCFRGGQNDIQICSLKGETDPLLEDIRKFQLWKKPSSA